jgi:hypothetical protein
MPTTWPRHRLRTLRSSRKLPSVARTRVFIGSLRKNEPSAMGEAHDGTKRRAAMALVVAVECTVGRTERGKESCSHLAHRRSRTSMTDCPSPGPQLGCRLLLSRRRSMDGVDPTGSPANLLVGGENLCRREGIERRDAGDDLTLVEGARTRGKGRSSAMESRKGAPSGGA